MPRVLEKLKEHVMFLLSYGSAVYNFDYGQLSTTCILCRPHEHSNKAIKKLREIVLGKGTNEMTAVHLVKTYCLPTLTYGCENAVFCDNALYVK